MMRLVKITRFTDVKSGPMFHADGPTEGTSAMSGFLLYPGGVRQTGKASLRRDVAHHGTGWLDWLALTLRVVSTRRQLAQMDDRMLKDIGITRSEALMEAERSPWDIGLPPGTR
jgi:uncharacterized protein YjiS (DUF1127 family)